MKEERRSVENKILSVGTMRTGGSLVSNLLSVHSKIIVLPSIIHFFRFIHGKYDPMNSENVERLLHHLRIRLKYRMNIDVDVSPILQAITARGPSYAACYDEIMNYFLGKTRKDIWGEYVTLQWREVPDFLDMFPKGKVVHIIRDLRGVLTSFARLSTMPENLYLNCIFNWIDSVNYMKRYRDQLPKDRYMSVRFEDVHNAPIETANSLCSFVGVPFEEAMIQAAEWPNLLDGGYVSAGMSVYTKKKVYGFDSGRSTKWRESIQEWELNLADFLAGEQLTAAGYECTLDKYDATALKHGMRLLLRQRVLRRNLAHYFATGEGTNASPKDPADPKNWGAPEDGFKRFVDSPVYREYQNEMSEVEAFLEAKRQLV